MSSVRSIAKQAGVSITTVSRVLNNHPRVSLAARRKVLTAANATNYVPAVGRKSTTNIAFLYTGESSLGSPFDGALMQGMSDGMDEFGYDLLVLDARRSRQMDETYTQMFLRKGVRGAVLRTSEETLPVCEAIADEGFPSVVVGARPEASGVNYIYTASRGASREAVEHLIALGHRRIAVCLNIVDDSDHADRLAGYRDALEAHGVAFDARLQLRAPARRDGGAQLIRRMMSLSDAPTAVFFTDPFAAIGAMTEARNMGVRVPEDLSVVGFDDAEVRHQVSPTLTAVCQDAVAIGREAFSVLHDKIEGNPAVMDGGVQVQRTLRAWLEIHDSTAAREGASDRQAPRAGLKRPARPVVSDPDASDPFGSVSDHPEKPK